MTYEQALLALENRDPVTPWKVAIVGSRDFATPDWVRQYVRRLPLHWTVVTGGARGVDSWAEEEARLRGLCVEVFHANWETHGKAAGMIRNQLIVKAADQVVAFWDGKSRGTKNTIDRAHTAGKSVSVIVSLSPSDG